MNRETAEHSMEQDYREDLEREVNRLRKLISVRESDWDATKARLRAVEALLASSEPWGELIEIALVRAALRESA